MSSIDLAITKPYAAIDKVINRNFIYDLVEESYCQDNGRLSMDSVMLIKIPFIQYLYGIKSSDSS